MLDPRVSHTASGRNAAIVSPARSAPRPNPDPTEQIGSPGSGLPRPTFPVLERHVRRSLSMAMLLLLLTAGLPGVIGTETEGPWHLWTAAGSGNSLALAFLGLLILVHLLPIRPRRRTWLAALVSLGLAGFAGMFLSTTVADGGFQGQPALTALFDRAAGAGWLVWVGALCLPTALTWQARDPKPTGARMIVAIAASVIALSYMGLHGIGAGETLPILALLGELGSAAYVGDRVGAALALVPAGFALAAVVASLARGSAPKLTGLALAWSAATALPLLALALFVAPSARWQETLEPLKAGLLAAAALLGTPAALGAWLAQLAAPGRAVPGDYSVSV